MLNKMKVQIFRPSIKNVLKTIQRSLLEESLHLIKNKQKHNTTRPCETFIIINKFSPNKT